MRELIGIGVFTVIEDVALVVWRALVVSGQRLGGVATLLVGFFLEHVVAHNVKTGASLINVRGVPLDKIAVNAVLETVVWVVWLLLWPLYPFALFGVGIPVVAIAFLEVALIVEHSLTDNIFHGRPLGFRLLNPKVFVFSTVENIGATAWLGLIGAGHPLLAVVALVGFQYLEHYQAIQLAQRRV